MEALRSFRLSLDRSTPIFILAYTSRHPQVIGERLKGRLFHVCNRGCYGHGRSAMLNRASGVVWQQRAVFHRERQNSQGDGALLLIFHEGVPVVRAKVHARDKAPIPTLCLPAIESIVSSGPMTNALKKPSSVSIPSSRSFTVERLTCFMSACGRKPLDQVTPARCRTTSRL